ncbi:MAG: hypothetical protein QF618_04045 [SAR324 cluster bacterium]|nr:hypothetical protein [SAR324 cluster bacterium]
MSQDSSSNPPERFLLIRTDRIGDTILTLIPGRRASAPNLNKAQYRLIIRLLLEKTAWTILSTGALGEGNFVHELAMDFPHERVKEW